MTSKFRLLTLGAMLGFGAVSFSGAGASAGALPLFPTSSGQVNTVSGGVIQVAHKRDHRMRSSWEARGGAGVPAVRKLPSVLKGYYYETPWWTMPLSLAAALATKTMAMAVVCVKARSKVRRWFRNSLISSAMAEPTRLKRPPRPRSDVL